MHLCLKRPFFDSMHLLFLEDNWSYGNCKELGRTFGHIPSNADGFNRHMYSIQYTHKNMYVYSKYIYIYNLLYTYTMLHIYIYNYMYDCVKLCMYILSCGMIICFQVPFIHSFPREHCYRSSKVVRSTFL